MASVQFYGKEKVLEAYQNCNIPAWGLFSGKQLLCRYMDDDINQGAQLLDEFISKIEGSSAVYTLKVFELKPGEKIKEKSECDSSFNFKIDEFGTYEERGQRFEQRRGDMLGKLSAIEDRLKAMEEDPEEEEEEEENFIDAIGSALKVAALNAIENPNSDNLIGNILKGLFTPAENTPTTTINRPAMIAGFNQDKTMNTAETTTEKTQEQQMQELTRIGNAIEAMQKVDNNLVAHLEKLAAIAIAKPAKFKGLLTMLDMM